MATLSLMATPRRHTNVLMHMAGHLKKLLDAVEAGTDECVEEYRHGLVPLVVPLTLLRHYVRAARRRLPGRTVLPRPHPRELMLRNHV